MVPGEGLRDLDEEKRVSKQMNPEEVGREIEELLVQVADSFGEDFPNVLWNGLACECDPSTGMIFVTASEVGCDLNTPCTDWKFQYLEQALPDLELPPWVGRYQEATVGVFHGQLTSCFAFRALLDAAAMALIRFARTEKAEARIQPGTPLELRSWSSSDMNFQKGRDRVRAMLGRV